MVRRCRCEIDLGELSTIYCTCNMQNMAMEENDHRSGSNVSKSSESFIQIDSISIDLISPDDKIDAGKCEHFSIRNYVSEMRKKDWKICWPFALDGDHKSGKQTTLLPPLDVPHFKWWQCQNCRQEIANGVPQAQKLEMIDGRTMDATTSTYNLCKNCHPSSCSGEKEKKAEVAGSITRHKIESEDNYENREMARLNSAKPEINSSPVQEQHANDEAPVALKSQRNGCEPGQGSHEVSEIKIITRNLEVVNKKPIEAFQGGMQTSADEMELTCLATDVVEKAHNASRGHANRVPSLEFDERNYASESADFSVGNDVQDRHPDKSLLPRKTRKVRLLTELLGENGNLKSKQVEIEDSTSNETPDASARVDFSYINSYQVAVRGITGSSGQNRKRKMPQDEEWRPPEISPSYNIKENIHALQRDAETTNSNLRSESFNVLNGTCMQTMKSHSSKCRIDENHILSKKKNKKPQAVDPCLSLLPSRENVRQEIQEKLGDTKDRSASDNISHKLLDNAFSRRLDSYTLPAVRTEPKSSISKKKSKMPVVDEGPITPFPRNNCLPRKCSIALKDMEIIQNGTGAIPFQSEKAGSSERSLYIPLKNCSATQRDDRKHMSQGEEVLPSLFPWKGGTSRVIDQVTRKDVCSNNLRDLSSFKSPDVFWAQGVNSDLGSKMATYRMPFLNEKQNVTSQTEDGSWHPLPQMDVSGVSNSKKAFPEHLAVKKRYNDRRVDKVQDKGALDGIPMEIVELMAKNQYERCLHDAENNKHLLETNNSGRNTQIIDYNILYTNRGSRLIQEQGSHKAKPQSKSGRNGVTTKGEVVTRNKQKSVDYLNEFPHFYRSNFHPTHLHQTHTPAGYSTFVQSQKKPSSGVQFSDIGPRRHGGAQNSKYSGDMVGPGTSYVQAFGGWNGHMPVSQPNVEAAHIWPRMRQNRFPFGYHIHPKGGTLSSEIDTLANSPSSLRKGTLSTEGDLKFFDLSGSDREKNNNDYSSETFSRTNAEYPFSCHRNGIELHKKNPAGSLDLYSNETIPAMHLLSLMDAGMHSSSPFTTDVAPKFQKKPPSPHDLKAKRTSGLDIDLNKTIDPIKYPSPDYYSKSHLSEKSYGCSVAPQATSSSAASFQYDKGCKGAINFTGQVSLKSRKKEKTRHSNSPPRNKDKRSQKNAFTSGGLGTKNGAFADHNIQKSLFDSSNSLLLTSRYHPFFNFPNYKFDIHDANVTLRYLKKTSETAICSVNENPSDFSIPEAGNIYMIGAKDLKLGKRIPSENRSGTINLDGRKRHRNLKCITVKERAPHQIS